MIWHSMEVEGVFANLKSSPRGLSSGDAAARLTQFGPNELIEKKKKSLFRMFLDQFLDFMILVLIAAALISGFIGEVTDTIAIVVIVIANGVIGFVQEYRAEKAMEALKKMAAPTATVLRDGHPETLPASVLVPGDMVVLEAGRIVPADLRLTETAYLKVDEATLTGESVPVEKSIEVLPDREIPLGDRKNMAYKGTFVTYGRGTGIVAETGMNTEFGRIASLLQDTEEGKTPLQKRMTVFGRKLAAAVLVICAVVLGMGLLRGEPPLLMFLTAISLAVAAIPEALPAIITIALALGARKLIRLKALIRTLPAVETLGSVTYICSDKTGTLTENRMTVEELFFNGRLISAEDLAGGKGKEDTGSVFLAALALSNDAQVGSDGELLGDPTETAFFDIAMKRGFDKSNLEKTHRRVAEIPFSSKRKCMTTFHEWKGGFISFTKGAVDVLAEKTIDVMMPSGPIAMDPEEMRNLNNSMAAEGLRVLCFAMRKWDRIPEDLSPENIERELTMIGLVGMIDPPRQEAMEAVSLCRSAGIRTVMITGDHPATARAIAGKIGMMEDDAEAVITGMELEKLSLAEFEDRVEHIRVYARMAPEQKLKIVEALQDRGQYVAMTGDGVNDAPALKRADIGIAMGITGTDVSKEASAMILLDDNFASIVYAVREGRKIYDNIRKSIRYLLSTNSGEIWTLFLASLVGLPIPLLPIHILWINLVTDGLPALALSVEPAEEEVMNRPPRPPGESLFAGNLGFHAVWVGLLMGGIALCVQFWSLRVENTHWQTMVFTVLCLTQLGHVLAIRSEKESLFKIGLFSNKYLFGAVMLTFLLQLATIYVPALNPIFKTSPLTAQELAVTLALSSLIFIAVEIEKFFIRRKENPRTTR
ncbi:MAG: cation-translocating P-type ATPase [Deltaproteobacteria bacterium]|nr:cation-translocating P-type ATPase [Deltaproteobacteria bacterium]